MLSGVLRKATKHLVEAEEDDELVWKDKPDLGFALEQLYTSLIAPGVFHPIQLGGANVLFLNLRRDPPAAAAMRASSVVIVKEHVKLGGSNGAALERISPFLRKQLPLKQLASAADVSREVAELCMQSLVGYDLAGVMELLTPTTRYRATRRLPQLLTDKVLASRCWEFCSKQKARFYEQMGPPSVLANERELKLFALYASLASSANVGSFCSQHDLGPLNERRLVQFGVLEGLLRPLQEHLVIRSGVKKVKRQELLDPSLSVTDLCVELELSREELLAGLRKEGLEFCVL